MSIRVSRRLLAVVVILAAVVGVAGALEVLGFGLLGLGGGDSGPDVLRSAGANPGAAPLREEDEGEGSAVVSPKWRGVPLFSFGNLYLEGRSDWFRERFDRDRELLLQSQSADAAAGFECIPKVLRGPFTEGEWLELLPEADRVLRQASEKSVVDTFSTMVIEGATPPELILYLACSDFRAQLDEGKVEVEWVFPGESADAECLDALPELQPSQMLTRERWSRPLAKPTDVWFVNAVHRDGELWSLVYEAWRNCGDDGYATVRMASGQYAVAPHGTGSLLSIRSFYCGQEIPALMDGVVVRLTQSYYENFSATVNREAPRWEPSERARRWFEPLAN